MVRAAYLVERVDADKGNIPTPIPRRLRRFLPGPASWKKKTRRQRTNERPGTRSGKFCRLQAPGLWLLHA